MDLQIAGCYRHLDGIQKTESSERQLSPEDAAQTPYPCGPSGERALQSAGQRVTLSSVYCGLRKSPTYVALPSTWPSSAFITAARVSNASAVPITSSFVSSAMISKT